MTPREFDHVAKNHIKKINHDWDMIRTLGAWMLQPYSKGGKVTPQMLMPLPGDQVKAKLMTKEEYQELLKRYN